MAGDVKNAAGTINPYAGTFMWSSLHGDGYSPAVRPLTLSITVPNDSPNLGFMTNWLLHSGGTTSSAGYVEVSTDGGVTWDQPLTGIVGGVEMPSIVGNSTGWVLASYDLSAYAGQSVKIRFRYVRNGTDVGAGWAIDNLTISDSGGVVFSDDAETQKPEWDAGHYWRRVRFSFRFFGLF